MLKELSKVKQTKLKGKQNEYYNKWRDKDYQKLFFEKLANKLNIQDLDNWRFVTVRDIYKHGGRSLLYVYGHSLQRAIESIYPHHLFSWRSTKNFVEKRHPIGYWNSLDSKKIP